MCIVVPLKFVDQKSIFYPRQGWFHYQKTIAFKEFRKTKHPIFQDKIKSQDDLVITKIEGNKTTQYQTISLKIKRVCFYLQNELKKWIMTPEILHIIMSPQDAWYSERKNENKEI